ncbi:MAG: nicotinamide mononucleotide transporter [Prolixibacteraceae bacterium]|nr:nicotinamide mononucleotide transporter [Prolixibacteraceae bacterium]
MLTWLLSNKIELLGAVLGLFYIFFSIRQHLLTWPIGLLTSIFYIIIFFQSGFYADMGLQVYYVVISIYGWYFWLKGKRTEENKKIPVKTVRKVLWLKISGITFLIFLIILFILKNYTNSTVPVMDSLTTAFSISATWMLARKYIEHWIIWIFVDIVSAGLYLYKDLWPTVILFSVYTAMAFLGYIEWKKDMKSNREVSLPG